MARKPRKWWQKKTNWGIIMGVVGEIMTTIVPLAPYAHIVFTIAAACGVYGIADRAGKPPEDTD